MASPSSTSATSSPAARARSPSPITSIRASPRPGGSTSRPRPMPIFPRRPSRPIRGAGAIVLSYPARTSDLTALPLAAGGTVDLHPLSDRRAARGLLDAGRGAGPHARLDGGAPRGRARHPPRAEGSGPSPAGDALWFSNGGRDYAPWNGRHVGVLGIEDARAGPSTATGLDQAQSAEPRRHPDRFDPQSRAAVEVRHVIGALPAPRDWGATAASRWTVPAWYVTSGDGKKVSPFRLRPDFLLTQL